MLPVLCIESLRLCYGTHCAVEQLSLEVWPREVFGLLGPNGSGKSSTLSAIIGTHAPCAGHIRVMGYSEADEPLEYRRQIGLVPQDLALYEELSARQNLTFFGKLYGIYGRTLQQRVEEVLEFIQLRDWADRSTRTFSGGMKRRLNLGCALLHKPRLLLLDEPTVGIDIQSREAIFSALRYLRDSGSALVFTTHHLEEAEQLCDRVGIMDQGRLLALGTIDELSRDYDTLPTGWRLDGPHESVAGLRLERVFLELTGRSLRE
ncbi:MAG: ABC transporter ATP-binding protein [Gemmataceae bacterium]